MWIARDRRGKLYLYSAKPVVNLYHHGEWDLISVSGQDDYFRLKEELFPEVTWESKEPKWIRIVDISYIYDKDGFDWVENYKNYLGGDYVDSKRQR